MGTPPPFPSDPASPRDVYVEMQNARLDVQQRFNPVLVQLAERIRSGDSLRNPDRWRFETDQFLFKTPHGVAY